MIFEDLIPLFKGAKKMEILALPWHEYPSTHAAVVTGGAEIVSHVYGKADILFEMESGTALRMQK